MPRCFPVKRSASYREIPRTAGNKETGVCASVRRGVDNLPAEWYNTAKNQIGNRILNTKNTKRLVPTAVDRRASVMLVILCWITYMVAYLTRNTYPAAIVHLVGAGALTESAAGLISAVYFSCYGAGHLINGILADRISPFGMLLTGTAGTVAANVVMPLITPALTPMAAVWAVNGFFESMLWAPIVAIFSESILPEHRKRAFELISTSRPIGIILAYLTSSVCSHLGWLNAPYGIAAVTAAAILAALAVSFGKLTKSAGTSVSDNAKSDGSEPAANKSVPALFAASGAAVFVIPVIFHGMLKDGVNTWVPTVLKDLFGVSESLSTALAILLPVCGLIGIAFANFLIERKRLKQNYPVIGSIIMLITSVPVVLLLRAEALGLAGGVVCLCLISMLMEAFNHTFSSIMPSEFAGTGKAATFSGIFNTLIYVGSAISTYAFGAIAEGLGWGVTIAVWLGLAVCSAIILPFAAKRWLSFLRK